VYFDDFENEPKNEEPQHFGQDLFVAAESVINPMGEFHEDNHFVEDQVFEEAAPFEQA
jgi:hypothetical protein